MKDDKAPERPARTTDYLAAEAERNAEDARELAAIAETVRPVVDAGKGRALAFDVVLAMLGIFGRSTDGVLLIALASLSKWIDAAMKIDRGERVLMYEATKDTPNPPPMTLLHIAGVADRIVSGVWGRTSTKTIPIETWIVHDIAEALRRACGCSDAATRAIRTLEAHGPEQGRRLAAAARSDQDFTARTLLPLILRDARRLCAAAKVDASAIEAAVARHGGTPS